jgi:hypothetical protein
MKRIITALIIILAFSISISAGSMAEPLCSQQSALGQTSLGRNNSAALMLSNPALLRYVPNTSFALNYNRLYNLSELDLINLAVSHDFGAIQAGFVYGNFGDADIMLENDFCFAASVKILSYASLGFDWSYRRLSFNGDYADLSQNSIGLGAAFDFEDIIFHASVCDLNSPRLSEEDEKTSPGYRMGISLMNISYLVLNLEMSGCDGKYRYHFGQEIMLEDKFFLRLGLVTNPTIPSAGFGLKWGRFQLDYAINRHSDLGETHSFGFAVNP